MNIIFFSNAVMSSLGVFFGERSSLLFWQTGNFIFVGKRNTTIQKYLYQHTENITFPYIFLRNMIFHFPSVKKILFFREKEMPSFLMIQERSYSSANFFGKTTFSEHLKNITYFHVFFFLREIIFHFPPKE